nr:actin-related protein 2/3 complex subunit 1A-like [Dasypus novemcinctus]
MVLSLDWDLHSVLLAAGSCDFKCLVCSASIKDMDEKPASVPWDSKMPFGRLMSEFCGSGTGGWVHGVSFSASGNHLACISTVPVADASEIMQVTTLKAEFLPLLSVLFNSENNGAADHYCCSVFFNNNDHGCLNFISKLDLPNRESSTKCWPWNTSATWTREPQPRTAVLPWRYCPRVASSSVS